jgi:chemotaxis protein MotA
VIGLLLGVLCLLFAIHSEGGHWQSFLRPTTFALVLGGALGATLSALSPGKVLVALFHLLGSSGISRRRRECLLRLARYSGIVRHKGKLPLDKESLHEAEPLVAKGMRGLADGQSVDSLIPQLECVITQQLAPLRTAERFYSSIAGYCPTFGLIGTVVGLITMFAQETGGLLSSKAISAAFVATFYGIALANLVFLPLAAQLRERIQEQLAFYEAIINGLRLVETGTPPQVLVERLGPALSPTTQMAPSKEQTTERGSLGKRFLSLGQGFRAVTGWRRQQGLR